MTDTSRSTPSLAEVVRVGIVQGADSDRITRIAEQVFAKRGWIAAQRRQFRDQVAELIAATGIQNKEEPGAGLHPPWTPIPLNRRLVMTHYVEYRDKNAVSVYDLTAEERRFLSALNARLMELEQRLKAEAPRIEEPLKKRLADPDNWLQDYEIEAVISFRLRKDDPAYDEKGDNILIELEEELSTKFGKVDLASAVNFNDFLPHHPLHGEHHCWLYHCLYDHTPLGWANVLRIGFISLDINAIHQHWIDPILPHNEMPALRR